MSKTVKGIVGYLEDCIKAVIPNVQKSHFQYNPEKNSSLSGFVYAIRAGSLSSSSQLVQSVNAAQNFEVELIKSFVEKSHSDSELEQIIIDLFDHHENVFKRISQRNSTEFQILNIPSFSSSAPEIDRQKKTVSITFTYQINYRKQLKEGV